MLEMSESITEIAAAFAAAQADFPELTEDSEGKIDYEAKGDRQAGGFKYGYASLGNVLATFRPALAAHGIAILQPAEHKPESGAITITVQTWLVHKSGQFFRSPKSVVFAPGGDLKKVGGAITYARRYQIGALLGVAPEEDTDDGQGQRKENVRQAPPRPPPARAAPKPDDTLAPGKDPAAMSGGSESPAQPNGSDAIRALIAGRDFQKALQSITSLPASPEKDALLNDYRVAKKASPEARS
jgi:hypothetical protein